MAIPARRHLAIKGTYNIRDLGGYPARTGATRWRRLLRADGLHRIDGDGMAALVAEGVATVIDLRGPREVAAQPNPFGRHDRVAYHNVPLFENLAPSYGPQTDTLYDLYIRALEERRPAITRVLGLIADAAPGTVLFHCTAGKDRTGLIAALLLANAGVETATIVEDYALTGRMIAPLIEAILKDAALHNANDEQMRPLLACAPETMARTIAYLESTYGSVAEYLAALGLARETGRRLETLLVGEA